MSSISSMPEESHIVLGPKHLRILVLGETGARKLSFIRLATGCDAQVGDGANPCTLLCTNYIGESGRSELIDTPGFDDLFKSNHEILAQISHTMWDVAALGPEALSHNRARVSGFIAAGTVFGELLNSGAIHQELWADNQDSDRKILAFFENSPHPMLTIQRELHSQKP
ncbi:hypothetical protein MGG_10551 [Pyricularia oryzae 70-15]|uniref:G domain-containing protein n=1 Tax=Pyricularia oryzae (strain 70-15 / ATCC MYA-4617 / FGSC 8958) TaxID=242507 RepID=G4MKG4_PYRO7|nr:uncharacterized protein MGG_10551 [Pyricularia oryzae 70-15]EHA57553.1 hypothetical protein MGG_10551 [Pyricularia oryzae 70-15]